MKICLFGASSDYIKQSYIDSVEQFGEMLARRGHTLVFGAGATGLMGAAARGTRRGGGKIIGISPTIFDQGGLLYKDCDEMLYTETMHERKALLRSKADAFAITPGGVGTFDEFFEVLTLRQLGVLTKPIGILNLEGVYDPLLNLLEKTIEGGFMSEECRVLWHSESDPAALLDYLERAILDPKENKNYAYMPIPPEERGKEVE